MYLLCIGMCLILISVFLFSKPESKPFSSKKIRKIQIYSLGKKQEIPESDFDKVLKFLNSLRLKKMEGKFFYDGNVYSIKILNDVHEKAAAETLIFFSDKMHWEKYDKDNKLISDDWYLTGENYVDSIRKLLSSL